MGIQNSYFFKDVFILSSLYDFNLFNIEKKQKLNIKSFFYYSVVFPNNYSVFCNEDLSDFKLNNVSIIVNYGFVPSDQLQSTWVTVGNVNV